MKFRFGKSIQVVLVMLIVLLLTSTVAYAQPSDAVYEVTITNLTESGQWFTPPVIATHRASARIFRLGRPASFELKEVAENGNLTPLVEALSNSSRVSDVVVAAGDPPPLMPGGSISVQISAGRGARFLSFASMLICTNDGFTGVDSMKLPRKVGQTRTVTAAAYDAGTEINTEDFADIVPPCQLLGGVSSDDEGTGTSNPALFERAVVHRHRGIRGISDLVPEIHGWDNPVTMITVTRIQ